MIALLQRVTEAAVSVDSQVVGRIEKGVLAFIAVEKDDDEPQVQRLWERILNYRLFADDAGKMNLSVRNIAGSVLLVPQFTLAADTDKGLRPNFSATAEMEHGRCLYDFMVQYARQQYAAVQSGIFGRDMQVSLINDGPVTFLLHVKPARLAV